MSAVGSDWHASQTLIQHLMHFGAGPQCGSQVALCGQHLRCAYSPTCSNQILWMLNSPGSGCWNQVWFACAQVITNVVSADYLSRPLEVFKEMHRVLKPVSEGCKYRVLNCLTNPPLLLRMSFHQIRCRDALAICFQGGLAIMSFSNR
jgi:hypothetical protein